MPSYCARARNCNSQPPAADCAACSYSPVGCYPYSRGDRPTDRPLDVRIPSATIGIRGTGMYLELGRRRSYFCLCYGTAVVSGSSMDAPVTIETRHHESPVWLDASGRAMRVMAAPFRNHTDDELMLLEALAGRVPPFRPDDPTY